MDAWERLEAFEDAVWHIEEAMEALGHIDRDAAAELADIRGQVAVKTERQRARVRALDEMNETALRREHEGDIL